MFVIGRRMKEDMRGMAEASGCSWIHLEALRYVQENGRPLMRGLAEYFSITPPAATLLVDGLVRDKLLRRIVDARDRRAVRIALTPKGRQFLARGARHRVRKIQEVFSVLDAREYRELLRILEKIAKADKLK